LVFLFFIFFKREAIREGKSFGERMLCCEKVSKRSNPRHFITQKDAKIELLK